MRQLNIYIYILYTFFLYAYDSNIVSFAPKMLSETACSCAFPIPAEHGLQVCSLLLASNGTDYHCSVNYQVVDRSNGAEGRAGQGMMENMWDELSLDDVGTH